MISESFLHACRVAGSQRLVTCHYMIQERTQRRAAPGGLRPDAPCQSHNHGRSNSRLDGENSY